MDNNIASKIGTISKMKKSGVFDKYIEYMTFSFYKNSVPGTRMEFESLTLNGIKFRV